MNRDVNIYSFNDECYVYLGDYRKLQQENEKLNHYKLLYQKVKDRNDKCINYIKYEAIIDNEYYRHEILDILKGNNETD